MSVPSTSSTSTVPSSSASAPLTLPFPPISYSVISSISPELIPHLHSLYLHEFSLSTFPLKSLPSLHLLLSNALLTLIAVPPTPIPSPPTPPHPSVLAFLVMTGDPLDPLLEDLIVHPSARGRGVGRALIGRAVTWAGARGAKRVDLYCRWDVKEFYEKCGFEKVRGEVGERCLMRRHIT